MTSRHTGLLASATLAFGAALIACPRVHAEIFRGLGHLAGGEFHSAAEAISNDGRVIVGYSESEAGRQAFRWTRDDGMVGLGDLAGGRFWSVAHDLSQDGSVIVGQASTAAGSEAFRWTAAGGMVSLGDFEGGGSWSSARGVSADGSAVVGVGSRTNHTRMFHWRAADGLREIDPVSGRDSATEALGISADGSVVVGYHTGATSNGEFEEAVIWKDGMMHALEGVRGWAADASADGGTIVGMSGNNRPFRWTPSQGVQWLTAQGQTVFGEANAISPDGGTVVGSADSLGAFKWDAEWGVRALRDILETDWHVDLAGWDLWSATGISAAGLATVGEVDLAQWNPTHWDLWSATGASADGQTIVGVGTNPHGQTEAWRAQLPTTSLIFREVADDVDAEGFWWGANDEIPGWDHVGFRVGDTVYESNVDKGGRWHDPLKQGDDETIEVASLPAGGVQKGFTYGAFLHNAHPGDNSHSTVREFLIAPALASKMAGLIEQKIGAGFNFIAATGSGATFATLDPQAQKGGDDTFTCVGLVEWAAEQAGYRDGQGFIPDDMEQIRFSNLLRYVTPIPVLSPQLLFWVLEGEYDRAAAINNWISGFFDPIDFILTDPLGRRLGYTTETGLLEEIPEAFYTGDGVVEQFWIPEPVPGKYALQVFGLGDEGALAAFGDRFGGNLFEGALGLGDSLVLEYVVGNVVIPEPVSAMLAGLALLLVATNRRR